MTDNGATSEREIVIDVSEHPELGALVADNFIFRKWVLGMLEGCEGCTAEARKWAEAMGLRHDPLPDSDNDSDRETN